MPSLVADLSREASGRRLGSASNCPAYSWSRYESDDIAGKAGDLQLIAYFRSLKTGGSNIVPCLRATTEQQEDRWCTITAKALTRGPAFVLRFRSLVLFPILSTRPVSTI